MLCCLQVRCKECRAAKKARVQGDKGSLPPDGLSDEGRGTIEEIEGIHY